MPHRAFQSGRPYPRNIGIALAQVSRMEEEYNQNVYFPPESFSFALYISYVRMVGFVDVSVNIP
jgi:hypothetical protein